MRFIVKEQRYETRIAAGQFRYERSGEATGALESWRLTQATAGYEVLRVDLDARAAASGHSYLYHLVRQENGRPERLAFRFWGTDLNIEGTLLFSEESITGTRTVNGTVYEEDIDVSPDTVFWFPATAGLSLALQAPLGRQVTAVSLNNQAGSRQTLALQPISMQLSQPSAELTEITIAGQSVPATPWQIAWADQQRQLLCDTNRWPLHMKRDDGLTAVETRQF